MWNPSIAHLFHLKRADMQDCTLHQFITMTEAAKGQ